MILLDLAIAVALSLLLGALLVAALYGLAYCGVWLLERWRHPPHHPTQEQPRD